MSRYKLTILYDGREFHGWQVQPGARTVQGTLQDALEKLTGRRPPVTGCSRTDAGVHANCFVCHTDECALPPEGLRRGLNAVLPDDLAVKSVESVDDGFHARYSCIGKEYRYRIWNAPYPNPFERGRALFYPRPIAVEALSFVGNELSGRHDFRSFMAEGSKITDTVRTISGCTLSREGEVVTLTVAADGFLYNMVRIIVGTYLAAAEGRFRPGDITALIEKRDRRFAGATVRPEGLYLNRVFYPENEKGAKP